MLTRGLIVMAWFKTVHSHPEVQYTDYMSENSKRVSQQIYVSNISLSDKSTHTFGIIIELDV